MQLGVRLALQQVLMKMKDRKMIDSEATLDDLRGVSFKAKSFRNRGGRFIEYRKTKPYGSKQLHSYRVTIPEDFEMSRDEARGILLALIDR